MACYAIIYNIARRQGWGSTFLNCIHLNSFWWRVKRLEFTTQSKIVFVSLFSHWLGQVGGQIQQDYKAIHETKQCVHYILSYRHVHQSSMGLKRVWLSTCNVSHLQRKFLWWTRLGNCNFFITCMYVHDVTGGRCDLLYMCWCWRYQTGQDTIQHHPHRRIHPGRVVD